MWMKAVLTALNRLPRALIRLTVVQEDTGINTLQKNIWIGPNLLVYSGGKIFVGRA
jgi:hypothetical protein